MRKSKNMSQMIDILFVNWKSDKNLPSSSNSKSSLAYFQYENFGWLLLLSACNSIKNSSIRLNKLS